MDFNTYKWDNIREANDFIDNYFFPAARIVEGDTHQWDSRLGCYVKSYGGREWFRRERSKYQLHPAVTAMMLVYKPDLWQQLLLEWPHRSQSDANRLAYTRDERAGEDDRQTVTTIGKYLRRHFSHAPDNLIRDIVAEFTYGGGITITNDLDAMIDAARRGPRSCMSGDFNIRCEGGKDRHPYEVYDPSLGWGMAIRTEGDEILGRCLVWQGDDPEDDGGEIKIFVRSYKREVGAYSHSGTDEAIESFLRGKGYEKRTRWPDNTPLMLYETQRGGYLMPYIDGGSQEVDLDHGEGIATIQRSGDHNANKTEGYIGCHEYTCDDCGAGFDEGEGGWTGRHEDNHVCQNCLDNDYTYVYGRRGNQYYIPSSDAIEVGDDYYDPEYLGDNNIVELADGDYCDLDNAVYVESEDAYYEDGDHRIVYAEDTERYEMKNDCWKCYATSNWYTDDTDYVEIDGETYHPDDAPEVETDDEDDDTDTATN